MQPGVYYEGRDGARLLPVLARHVLVQVDAGFNIRNCVQLLIIREGTLLFKQGDTKRRICLGEIVLVSPRTNLVCEAGSEATVTKLLIDTDYLIESIYQQHLDRLPDRHAARDLASKLYPDSVLVLRLGRKTVEHLAPNLEELVTLTKSNLSLAGYFRALTLLFTVFEAMSTHSGKSRAKESLLSPIPAGPKSNFPVRQGFRPVRQEAARVAELMREDISKPWRIDDFARQVCLSPSQLTRVFRQSFGVTPMACLSILRVHEMARLIRETDLLISVIAREVGWNYRSGNATQIFRRHMGVTPMQYRRNIHHAPKNG